MILRELIEGNDLRIFILLQLQTLIIIHCSLIISGILVFFSSL